MKDKTFFEKLKDAVISAPSADVAALQASVESLTAQVGEMNAALEAAAQTIQEADAKVAEYAAKAADYESKLAEVQASDEAKAQAAAEALKNARMSRLVAAVGDLKADGVYAATQEMNDQAFEAVVAAMEAGLDREAKSFAPAGVDATANSDAVAAAGEGESLEAKMLRQKYHSNKE